MQSADPPFRITPSVLALVSEIERSIGRAEGVVGSGAEPRLRKPNRVSGKRVVGSRREILEVENANRAYEEARTWRASREEDLLTAHAILMKGLTEPAGAYRRTNVGIVQGARVAHVAPPARRVPGLMRTLLGWIESTSTPALIRSCVAHYEMLFIHPFTDGNGRMARLWQHVLLLEAAPILDAVPMESVIRDRQGSYYDVLGQCDRSGDRTAFVEFALEALRDAIGATLSELRTVRPTPATRLAASKRALGRRWFRRADYLRVNPSISTATASRDLRDGVTEGALEQRGTRRTSEYRFR